MGFNLAFEGLRHSVAFYIMTYTFMFILVCKYCDFKPKIQL